MHRLKDLIGNIGKYLTITELAHFGQTCRLVYGYYKKYMQLMLNNRLLTLKFMHQMDPKWIAKFLDRFFWDNVEVEKALMQETSMPAIALYALFAPRETIKLNVVAIDESIKFLLNLGFNANSALMLSLQFLVAISTGPFNFDLFPRNHAKFHINLRGIIADKFQLIGCILYYANLSDCSWQEGNFTKANLHGANLRRSNFKKTTFDQADLTEANLSFTNVKRANFFYARLSYANLCNANAINANLNHTNLMQARRNKHTRFFKPFSQKVKGMIKDPTPQSGCRLG